MDRNSQRAKEIIKRIQYITIATSGAQGQPWNTPVYAAPDEEYNFYWISWKANLHSQNIGRNPKVFVVIYDSTAPEGTGEGVYIKGEAFELSDEKEIAVALVCLAKRINKQPENVLQFLGDSPRRVYKLMPRYAWINMQAYERGQYVDKRISIVLDH